MCNACGFRCCAHDSFSGCGCDHCSNPACWSDDEFDDEDGPLFDDGTDDPWGEDRISFLELQILTSRMTVEARP